MIFYLKCTVADLTATSKDELEEVVSKLIDSDRYGRHYFVLNRKLCDWIKSNLNLSEHDRAHLVSIREQYAVRGGLLDVAYTYVKVVLGDTAVSLKSTNSFVIGHKQLIEGSYLLTQGGLVVEDIDTDYELYLQIFSETTKISNIPSFSVDAVHGGGSKTHSVFNNEICKRRVVVCIVDHDKLAPADKKSPTARKVERIHTRRNLDRTCSDECFIGLGIVTIGRELENYIPYHLLKVIDEYRDYPDYGTLDEIVHQIGKISTETCYWQYFDIKDGINGEKLRLKKNNGDISYNVFDWICGRIGCEPQNIEEYSVKGFGDGVVNAFLSCPQARSGFHKFVRSDYWQFAFGNYFERLLWFFVAPNARRT